MTSYTWNKTLKCDLVILGDSGVGKTSIMMRYANDEFSSSFISTVGEKLFVLQTIKIFLVL